MHFLRKLVIFLVATLFVVLLFSLPALVAINRTIGNADTIKTWLRGSKVYDNVVTNLIDKANESISNKDSGQGKTNAISHPEVKAAAEKAFSPQFLQSSAESVIDGYFNWMKGKTEKPEFRINLTSAKQQFANQINTSAKARYAALPICPKKQALPSDFDPFAVTCRYPGFNANAEIDKQTNEIVNGKDVFNKDTFTADDLGYKQQPLYKDMAILPTLYRLNQIGIPVLAALAAVIGAGLIFLYEDHRRGLKKVATKFITVGALILVGIVLTGVAFGVLNNKIEDKTVGASSSLNQSGLYIARQAEQGINNVNKWFGISYVLIGVIILVILKYILKPTEHKTAEHHKEPPHSTPKTA